MLLLAKFEVSFFDDARHEFTTLSQELIIRHPLEILRKRIFSTGLFIIILP